MPGMSPLRLGGARPQTACGSCGSACRIFPAFAKSNPDDERHSGQTSAIGTPNDPAPCAIPNWSRVRRLVGREPTGYHLPMSTFTAILEADPDGSLHLPLPPELHGSMVKVSATLEAAEPSKNKPRFGCLAGKIAMAPDFDDPLDDFKEYTA